MISFPIRLQCISDFESYVVLLERFKACGITGGIIQGRNYQARADDIIKIFEHYQPDGLVLSLTGLTSGDITAISHYLSQSGLLTKG